MPSLQSEAVARASGSNFISSFWFLPVHKRRAMNVIYAYCRLTDDIVDLAQEKGTPLNAARQELEDWRKLTVAAVRGTPLPGSPAVLLELSRTVTDYKIPEEHLMGLIDGCQMDLEKNSYSTFSELYEYCYRVAGTVGLMCLPVFGAQNIQSRDFAVSLGLAFQLTNILRDVKSDIARGRIYFPQEDLSRFELTESEFISLPTGHVTGAKLEKFKNLMVFEIERAESFYEKANSEIASDDKKNLAAALVMAAVYRAILKKIGKNPLAILDEKIRLSRAESLIMALQGWFKSVV
ncbi:MAG: hypothetical protein A2901_08415 [Elusimicrobia bacterium RIFCSPLOWO2_01_FULL_54_10]|nr:MAG: hypothetical protein A2901_08415 [Elusimicrobia bacterium RIFCSPLOWO2_01_FULL_54_10]